MIEVRWHGRGGQGGFTVSRLLGMSAALFENKYAMAFPSFGPERRGAPVLAFTRIDNHKITDRSEVKECDYVVVMDETLINKNITDGLKNDGTILINTKNPEKYSSVLKDSKVVSIDATSIALEILKRPITNTAMFGALVAVSNVVSLDSAIKSIETEMKPSLVQKNIELVKKSYEIIRGGCNE
ncbi:MAG: 2-oxoacid:acceptor oxidoreductase family protein [Bacteroidales bacterium]|nr:2-oxoacid:acceptor oxidoreductase family protein [Bacteroidales bacterium]